MSEYLCVTVRSRPSEAESSFTSRLSELWTDMLRNHPDEFEKVYAETAKFEPDGGVLTRQYLFEAEIVAMLTAKLRTSAIDHDAIDEDDVYSKYEAVPPEWFWIEH